MRLRRNGGPSTDAGFNLAAAMDRLDADFFSAGRRRVDDVAPLPSLLPIMLLDSVMGVVFDCVVALLAADAADRDGEDVDDDVPADASRSPDLLRASKLGLGGVEDTVVIVNPPSAYDRNASGVEKGVCC